MHDQWMMRMGSPLAFVAIWTVMMVAMMLPPLIPVLRRYPHPLALAAGYFLVWAAFGTAAYLGGMFLLQAMSMSPLLTRVVPLGAGVVLLTIGLVQFSGWKVRHLSCCRASAPGRGQDVRSVWWDGVRLGWHCCRCCVALMALLFILGMMNLEVITLVGILIAAERLAPRPVPVVRAIGVVILAVGAAMILRR
jgi:predicted metal-binding membrane protein